MWATLGPRRGRRWTRRGRVWRRVTRRTRGTLSMPPPAARLPARRDLLRRALAWRAIGDARFELSSRAPTRRRRLFNVRCGGHAGATWASRGRQPHVGATAQRPARPRSNADDPPHPIRQNATRSSAGSRATCGRVLPPVSTRACSGHARGYLDRARAVLRVELAGRRRLRGLVEAECARRRRGVARGSAEPRSPPARPAPLSMALPASRRRARSPASPALDRSPPRSRAAGRPPRRGSRGLSLLRFGPMPVY